MGKEQEAVNWRITSFGRQKEMKKAFVVGFLLLCSSTAQAASLDLSLLQVTDISGLGFNSVGGAAFDDSDGRLWLTDAAGTTNDVVEIDPITGAVISSFDASVVPGLTAGPDAMALNPTTGNLFLFSTFTQFQHGEVTQGGVLVNDLGETSTDDAGGATFAPDGSLLILDEGDGAIKVVDQTTGAITSTTALSGFTGRVGAADFDPVTGNLFAYATGTMELLEIDYLTGVVLSFTPIGAFFSNASFPTRFAFNADGSQLYFSNGTGSGGDELLVFNRTTDTEVPEPSTMTLLGLGSLALWRRRKQLN